jgi:hypothetical protein
MLPIWFPLPEALQELLYGWEERPIGIIHYLPTISGLSIWQALLLPIFIYAIVLKARGARIPLAMLDLAACALVGNVLRTTIPVSSVNLPIALLAMFLLMGYRGHLGRRVTYILAVVSLGLWVFTDIFHLTALYYSTSPGLRSLDMSIIQFKVLPISWLPLSIALPIALMAKPYTPQLRPQAEKSWQLTSVLLLTGALVTASYIFYQTTTLRWIQVGAFGMTLPSGIIWMVSTTILVMLLWFYKTGRALREFLTFLGLALGGFVVMESVLPLGVMPGEVSLWLFAAVAALTALVLSTDIPFRRTNLWAAGALLVGSIAAAFWHSYMYERFIKRTYDLQWRIDLGEFVKTELALLVALTLFVLPLLLAWWFACGRFRSGRRRPRAPPQSIVDRVCHLCMGLQRLVPVEFASAHRRAF